jgi:hypothetical protein
VWPSGANRIDFKMAQATLESVPVERPEPAAADPQGLCLEKRCDYEEMRDLAEKSGTRLCGRGARRPGR